MRIREKSLFYDWFHMHREPESADLFFSQIQPLTQTTVIECATQFLLSDVLHCTNMNTDFIDLGNN